VSVGPAARNDQSPIYNSCLIGVDGGGSSCRVALVCDGKRHEVKLGRANVETDRVKAIATVRAGMNEVAAMAGVDARHVPSIVAHIGLAGVGDKSVEQAVAAQLALPLATISEDQVTHLVGAFGDGDGVVAGIGTGSFLARQVAGQHFFAGGWGTLLGDEAAGAWLGRKLLSATLHALDQQIQATDLTRSVLHRFGSGPAIVRFADRAHPVDLADFAPDIIAAATLGDGLARDLLQTGADYIDHGLRRIGWTTGEAVCLTGGLGATYAPLLGADLRACLQPPQGSALDGALTLAARRRAREAGA